MLGCNQGMNMHIFNRLMVIGCVRHTASRVHEFYPKPLKNIIIVI